jgi:hypothetical protein
VVARAGRGAEVPQPQMRVTGDGGEDAVRVGAPLGGVGAAVGGEGEGAAFSLWVPDLDGAVPGGGGEVGLGDEVPGAGEGFAGVFGEGGDGEGGVEVGVEEAEGAVAAGGEDVGGVCF